MYVCIVVGILYPHQESSSSAQVAIYDLSHYLCSLSTFQGIVIGGTLSITSNEVYFEVDEEDEEFRSLDARVLNHSIDVLHFKFSFQVRVRLFFFC